MTQDGQRSAAPNVIYHQTVDYRKPNDPHSAYHFPMSQFGCDLPMTEPLKVDDHLLAGSPMLDVQMSVDLNAADPNAADPFPAYRPTVAHRTSGSPSGIDHCPMCRCADDHSKVDPPTLNDHLRHGRLTQDGQKSAGPNALYHQTADHRTPNDPH